MLGHSPLSNGPLSDLPIAAAASTPQPNRTWYFKAAAVIGLLAADDYQPASAATLHAFRSLAATSSGHAAHPINQTVLIAADGEIQRTDTAKLFQSFRQYQISAQPSASNWYLWQQNRAQIEAEPFEITKPIGLDYFRGIQYQLVSLTYAINVPDIADFSDPNDGIRYPKVDLNPYRSVAVSTITDGHFACPISQMVLVNDVDAIVHPNHYKSFELFHRYIPAQVASNRFVLTIPKSLIIDDLADEIPDQLVKPDLFAFRKASVQQLVAAVREAGRPKRKRRRYVVEIDGQEFDVETVQEASDLLEKAKELAEKVVTETKQSTIVKPGLRIPQIRTPNRELVPLVQAARSELRNLYEEVKRDLEIRMLLARAEENDEEEAIIRLLM